ncbi:hypothetical protein N9K19_00685 [Gammaproteobacteria bacterium]|nr:hypothetical protein [Gammaproteobacteria bacterium]
MNLPFLHSKAFQHNLLAWFFIAAWINLPGLLYERFGIDSFLAFHGKNLLPFFIPLLIITIILIFQLNHDSKRNLFQKFSVTELAAFLFLFYIVLLEAYHSASSGIPFSWRVINPLICFYFFYVFYLRFSYLAGTSDLNEMIITYSAYILFFILVIHLLGYAGLFPHYKGTGGEGTVEGVLAITTGGRIDVIQLNLSSYYAAFLVAICLFYSKYTKLGIILKSAMLITALFAVYWNQTRGAFIVILALFILWIAFNPRINFFFKALLLVSMISIISGLAITFSGSRIFNLVDSSGLERILMYVDAYYQILLYPFFGLGEGFENTFRPGLFAPLLVHSFILRYTIAYGIVSVGIFLLIFFFMHAKASFKYRLVSFALFIGIGSFETYIFWWFSILPILAIQATKIDAQKMR